MTRTLVAMGIGLLFVTAPLAFADGPDAVFDVAALTSTPLNAKTTKTSEKDGIVTEEVMFHSEMDGEKSVDIFAFFSYPKGAAKLPAFIWNQGGLGQASSYWTEFGAKRGYAAMCIDFPLPGYRSTGGYNISSGLELTDDPKKAPIARGVTALLKAVSFLESRAEVDAARIGMCGSSWGGFYTTLMVGIDPRLKVGSAMFGTGNLQLGNNWWDGRGWDAKRDAAFRERWRSTLDPALRLANRKTPIGWFTGTNDVFYWMPALMATYDTAAGPKHLSLLPNWDHGLTPVLDEQVFAWLDVNLKGAPAFIQVAPLQIKPGRRNQEAQWTFSGARPAASAELLLSYGDAGAWSSRYWLTLPAKIKGDTCTVALPPNDLPYYISGNIVDKDGFRYSTPLVKVPAAEKPHQPARLLDYDGCSQWGGFDKQHTWYLDALAWRHPAVTTDAHRGDQAVQLKPGTANPLPPMYHTPGVAHRFECYLKADKATTVNVELVANADRVPTKGGQDFAVGTSWTKVQLVITPAPGVVTGLAATITVPAGANVVCDTVSLHPVR